MKICMSTSETIKKFTLTASEQVTFGRSSGTIAIVNRGLRISIIF